LAAFGTCVEDVPDAATGITAESFRRWVSSAAPRLPRDDPRAPWKSPRYACYRPAGQAQLD